MTEAKKVANLLNSTQYPQIVDNTLNIILACHDDIAEAHHIKLLKMVIATENIASLKQFRIKHPLNGEFLVLQADIN